MFELDSSQGTTNRELKAPELESAPKESVTSANVSPTPGATPMMHARVIRGWFWRSFAVIAEVAVALLLREAIAHHRPGFAPFITFYPVLLLAALLDGLWAGIAVTALSTLVAAIWVFPPIGKFVVSDPYDVVSLGIFFSFGVSLSIVVERYHRNREKLAAFQVQEAVSSERRKREVERKLAETMQAERQRLYDVLETLPTMVSLLRTDHRVAFANRSFREKFGEPEGRRCFETRYGRAEPCEICETFIPLKTGQPHHREVSFPDNSVMEAYDFPFRDLDGSSLILEMGVDITDRRRAETELKKYREQLEELVAERTRQLEAVNARLEAEIRELEQAQQSLRESRAKLEAALSSMTDSVIITDAEGLFVEFNDAFATLYRFKDKAECTRSFSEFSNIFEVTAANGERISQEMYPMWRALRGESATNVEFNYRRRDSGETWVGSLSFSPIRGEDGVITGSVISARDITDQKRTEEALRQSEKIALQREQFQALAESQRSAREEERTRVSRDLHDQIGQILTAIKLDLMWINRRLPTESSAIRDRLRSTVGLINDGVRSVRRICSGLRPGVLDDLGLAAAIEWQANEFAARTGIGCKVSVPAIELALNGDQATEFFRIFQECLTNVMRHAEAETVSVSLHEENGDLVLIVGDDGKGFRESDASGSLGFLGMRERAQVCGGNIQIASSPGNGTTVTLRVPMHPADSDETDYAHSDCR
jgi:two-component system, NarL family, sensor histidine kinase UhpB